MAGLEDRATTNHSPRSRQRQAEQTFFQLEENRGRRLRLALVAVSGVIQLQLLPEGSDNSSHNRANSNRISVEQRAICLI